MSLAVVYSRAQVGIEAPQVTVEVYLSGGLPSLSIVGLPETAVRESKDRVRAALLNAGFEFPQRRITISLAPADLPKEGGRYDLPIALGVLAASKQLKKAKLDHYEFLGELTLSGLIQPVRGVLPAALEVRTLRRLLVIPCANGAEAALVEGCRVLSAGTLLEVVAHLHRDKPLESPPRPVQEICTNHPDLADVRGQYQARRALEIAAAGAHNLLMAGPPGSGKTMLARRLPGILPPMSEQEAMESASIASISGQHFEPACWRQRKIRSPHHTASGVALVGGGSRPRPGEISLAHNGVLFLDELPEYNRRVLEVLREPLESGHIVISRAALQSEFPARFQLIAAMNPCPCGYLGEESGQCNCSAEAVSRYRGRISGPLLDRIDLHIEVPRISPEHLNSRSRKGEPSATIRRRVIDARQLQLIRAGKPNALLLEAEVRTFCQLAKSDREILHEACEKLHLSARAYTRIIKIARTIADLDQRARIGTGHLSEAIGYRRLSYQPTGC